MKKRTVITTEKRELWFIRSPLESNQESDDQNVRPQGDEKEIVLFDEPTETTDSTINKEREFTEREVDHVS